MTPVALAKYRECERIRPARDFDQDRGRFVDVCANDGLRIYPIRRGWRHDTAAIKSLAAIERGEKVTW